MSAETRHELSAEPKGTRARSAESSRVRRAISSADLAWSTGIEAVYVKLLKDIHNNISMTANLHCISESKRLNTKRGVRQGTSCRPSCLRLCSNAYSEGYDPDQSSSFRRPHTHHNREYPNRSTTNTIRASWWKLQSVSEDGKVRQM